MKAISRLQLAPAPLRELWKAVAARKRRKALASGKAKPSGEVVDEVQSSYKPLQQPAGKRKAAELSTSRQPRPTEGWPEYAAVVAGRAFPCQESGPLKPTASGRVLPDLLSHLRQTLGARLLETYPGTPDTPMETTTVASAGERHTKAPSYVSGVTDTHGFLAWLRKSYPSGLSSQIKGERHAGYKDSRWLASKGVSFHTFSLPEDGCVRLLLTNLGKQMPDSVVREELEALGIHVQGVLQLRSGRSDQNEARDRPPTPHFTVPVARGAEVQKVRSLTELGDMRVSVESYVAPKAPLQCKHCQRFGHTQRKCGYPPRCVACGEANLSGRLLIPKQQLKYCTCRGKHTANYRGCLMAGKRTVYWPTSCAETSYGGTICGTEEPRTRLEPRCSRGSRCEGYRPKPS
jgi:hypothetical protein